MDEITIEMFKDKERKNLFATYNHIEMVMVEEDHAVFRLNIKPESKNSYGMVHGGAIYAMADNATGFAAHTDGRNYVTQTSALHFLRNQSEGEIQADAIHVTENIAIVAAVGRKMAYQPGSSGKIFATLGENGINIRMITQGPEELNIIVGVDDADFAPAIRVLYDSFVK